jgi:trk system potassium uptake protein TrkH
VTFLLVFLVIFALSTVVIFLEGATNPNLDLSALEATSVAIATLGNIGPGFGVVGPMNSFTPFSDPAKLYMVVLMWVGRLEILSVLVILTPSYWKR